jgi:hypothetical protein
MVAAARPEPSPLEALSTFLESLKRGQARASELLLVRPARNFLNRPRPSIVRFRSSRKTRFRDAPASP